MTKFLEIAASSDEVNIVVFDGRLWAACKKCRDRGINDFELKREEDVWNCKRCGCEVSVDGVMSNISIDASSELLRSWVADWLGVPSYLVEVSIGD